jgi:hypothetical protein
VSDRLFTFADLVRRPETKSLAYWIGLFWPARVGEAAPSALGVARSMAYQYDIEEQAGRLQRVFPEDAEWRRYFLPIAPVQLTDAWSPISDAVDRLGDPSVRSAEGEDDRNNLAALVGWGLRSLESAHRSPNIPRSETDRARLHGLLTVAIARAKERSSDLLICAKPGWSHTHGVTFDGPTKAQMTRAGFALTDRRPRAPGD